MNENALGFIQQVELPEAPPQFESLDKAAVDFGSGQQAAVVGTQVAEFTAQVASLQRGQVADCLLFAQLAANQSTKGNPDLMAWYRRYVEVLQNTGWTMEAMNFEDRTAEHQGLNVHQAIVPVLTALLGPAAAAASMVVSVLNGLQSMNPDSSWITLFDRTTQHASGAKLQFAYVDAGQGDGVSIRLLAVALDARHTVTQVLFFRLSRQEAKLKTGETQLGISGPRLQAIAPAIGRRVEPFLLENIATIDIG